MANFATTAPTDKNLQTSDVTNNDVSTSKHGFAPKSPNDTTKFLNGAGAYTVPAGGASPHAANFTPADPTLTASATQVMMGIGSTVSFTPTGSGNMLVLARWDSNVSSAHTATYTLKYGTGTAPTNGAAVTGTTIATSITKEGNAIFADIGLHFWLTGLTPATAYWFDLAVSSSSGNEAPKNILVTIFEL